MSVLDEVLCTGHGVGDVVPVLHYLEEKRTYTFAKPAECGVVPELLRTLVFARPCGGDQFAAGTVSPSLDMSR